MEHQAQRRFSSARELERALENLPRMDRRYRAWRKSCQTAAAAVGAGLLLSAFCTLWGWMDLRQQTGRDYNSLIAQAQQLDGARDYEGAEELLFRAIQLERKRPEAYANLAALLYRQGEYRQAIDLLSGLEPEGGAPATGPALAAQGQIQYVLASCHYQLEDYRQALPYYQLAAALCPEEPAYCRDLAVCCARLGYDGQAQEAVARLAGLGAQPGDGELAAGEIAYAAGRYEQALELLEQAARAAQDHAVISRASLQAAQCCRQLGQDWLEQEAQLLENAASRLDAAENGPQLQALAETLFRLAAAQPQRSQDCYEQALSHLEELMARGAPPFAVRQNAALALEYLDRFQEAEELLLQLREDYPRDYRPPMRLALLYADQLGQDGQEKFMEQYQLARTLYAGAEAPDGDMARLEELAGQFAVP